ncbi:hypothetical protein [Snuella sedimenti]|nr:hypothetical protein [Snuella sedimenti]
MKTINRIYKHLDNITQGNDLFNRRTISFKSMSDVVWKGSKRYAH